MRLFRFWVGPGRRWLARSLDQLRCTLESLREKLHGAVASSVGQTVGGLVSEVIQALAVDPYPVPPPRQRWGLPSSPSPPHWREDDPWFDPPEEALLREEAFEEPEPDLRNRKRPASSRVLALTVGLRTTLGWLQQRAGRRPVWTALGIGLLTGLTVYVGGPLAAAGVGLAGSALGLVSLSETVRAVANGLAALSAE